MRRSGNILTYENLAKDTIEAVTCVSSIQHGEKDTTLLMYLLQKLERKRAIVFSVKYTLNPPVIKYSTTLKCTYVSENLSH